MSQSSCPFCESNLCGVALEQDRDFHCYGHHFEGCGVYIRVKNGLKVRQGGVAPTAVG